jgi:phospholipid transport system substrate-binding protein
MRAIHWMRVFGMVGVLLIGAPSVRAEDAGGYVQRLGEITVALLDREDLAEPVRRAELRRMLVDNIDIAAVSRVVLGRHWRLATDEQKARYGTLYPDFIVTTYSGLFGQYSGEILTVTGSRSIADGDTLVEGDIERSSGPPAKVAFRVRPADGGFKVIDVVVEGISLLVTQRSDFAAVINREGMDGFLDRLEVLTKKANTDS